MAPLPGDYGKVRLNIVVQSDRLAATGSVLVCPLTSDHVPARLTRIAIDPTPDNGLRLPSQCMVEKITVISRARCRDVIGRIDKETLERLGGAIAFALGLMDEA